MLHRHSTSSTSYQVNLIILMKIIITIALLLLCLAQAQPEQVVYEEEELEPLSVPDHSLLTPEPETTVPQPDAPVYSREFNFSLKTLMVYKHEMLAVLGVLVYLLIFMRGKRANVKLMERFYRKVAYCLEANFAHIGFSKTSGEAPFNGESPSDSTYYATGRDNVDGIEMKFETKKRQDFIYQIMDIFFPAKDTVTIDLPVKNDIPLVLAIVMKKQIKELTEKNLDIRTMTRQFKVGSMEANYEVLGEAADTVDSIVDKHVVKAISNLNGFVLSIHYTDLNLSADSTGHLRVVLNLAHKNQENFLPGLELALYLVDKIANFKISASSKVKAIKSREAYNQSKEKEQLEKHKDELRKKKEDKFRQEEARMRSLPADKQKKEEEKRKKKEFNKMTKAKR